MMASLFKKFLFRVVGALVLLLFAASLAAWGAVRLFQQGVHPIWIPVFSLISGIAIGLVAISTFQKLVLGPLAALQESVRQWRSGNPNHRTLLPSQDEFQQLGNNLQELLTSFSTKQKEWEALYRSSQDRQAELTDLLEKTVPQMHQEHEQEIAALVQKTLFSKADPVVPGIELASFYERSSKTGGDWYGFLEDLKGQRLVFGIGRVTAPGPAAGLLATASHSIFQTLGNIRAPYDRLREAAAQTPSTANPVQKVIQAFLGQLAQDPYSPRYLLSLLNRIITPVLESHRMTFVAATLQLKTRILTYANAGHEPPIVYRHRLTQASSSRFHFLNMTGPKLGEQKDSSFKEHTVTLAPGDLVFFHTDGLLECKNPQGDMFGSLRLSKFLERTDNLSASEVKDRLVLEIHDFCGPSSTDNNFVFVAARVPYKTPPEPSK